MVNNHGLLIGLLMINGYNGFIHGYLVGGFGTMEIDGSFLNHHKWVV